MHSSAEAWVGGLRSAMFKQARNADGDFTCEDCLVMRQASKSGRDMHHLWTLMHIIDCKLSVTSLYKTESYLLSCVPSTAWMSSAWEF